MKFDVPRGVVIACVLLGFGISAGPGLVARAAEPDRWLSAIAADASEPVAGDAAAQHRIAELERRIKELEAERGGVPKSHARSEELSAAQTRNDELTARNRALSLENRQLQSHAFDPSVPAAMSCEPRSDADPKAQLRYWAKQIRDRETGVGKLTPEWKSALNLLLRRERQLDPHNPWRDE
jgi:hypothetical protein